MAEAPRGYGPGSQAALTNVKQVTTLHDEARPCLVPLFTPTLQFNQPHSVYRETTCHMVAIVMHWDIINGTLSVHRFVNHFPAPLLSVLYSSSFFLFVSRAIATMNKHRNRHMHSCAFFVGALVSFIHPVQSRD